jgi:hypothetical protein
LSDGRDPVVDYAETYWFPVRPPELWGVLESFDRYELWWGWLRRLQVERDGLVDGNVLRATVAPPLPFRMSVTVRLDRCERPSLVDASVDGDLRGRAVLWLEPAGTGTQARIEWSLGMVRGPVRSAARVAYPVVRWGHDRVVEMAVEAFRRQALPTTTATGVSARGREGARPT